MTMRIVCGAIVAAVLAIGCDEPKTSDEAVDRGDTHRAMDRDERALDNYRDAVELQADNVEAYRRLGLLQLQRGNLTAAREAFLNALTLEPDSPTTHYRLGLTYVQMGNIGAARHQERVLRDMHRDRVENNKPIDPEIPVMADQLAKLIEAAPRR